MYAVRMSCCLLFRKCMYVVVVVLFMSTYYDMAAKARGLNFSSSKALKKQPLTKPSVFFLMPRLRLTTPAPSSLLPRPFLHTTHDMRLLHAQVWEKGGKNGKTNTTFAYKLHCFICFAFEPNSISNSSITRWNGWTENQKRKGKMLRFVLSVLAQSQFNNCASVPLSRPSPQRTADKMRENDEAAQLWSERERRKADFLFGVFIRL